MRVLTAILAAITGLMLVSDILYRYGVERLNRGGTPRALALAGRLNPLSMNVRFTQIETLFKDWQFTGEHRGLEEAVLIARSVARDFPGNAQAKAAYATAVSLEATHPVRGAVPSAQEAMDADPISVAMIEREMFNLAVFRYDQPRFLSLGIRRAALTREPLLMKCSLCGREWMKHGR